MTFFFGAMSVGLLLAVVSRAALTWDGGLYLYTILENGAPFAPHDRLINVPLHWPVQVARRYTDDAAALGMILTAVYALVPVVALAASWLIVRQRAPQLFVWAALAIALGTLPGQMFFVSEAIVAVQLFWPILLAVLSGAGTLALVIVAPIAAAMVFAHPFASALFALAAASAVVLGLVRRHSWRRMALWAIGLLGLALLSLVRFSASDMTYETNLMSRVVLQRSYEVSVAGLPFLSLTGAWLAGGLTLAALRISPLRHRQAHAAAHWLGIAAVFTGAVLLTYRGLDPALWIDVLEFRLWVFFITLPFVALALLDAVLPTSDSVNDTRSIGNRLRTAQLAAVVFASVIAAHSVTWHSLLGQLEGALANSSHSCMSASSLGWLGKTPLNHWSVRETSVLVQGRSPQVVLLDAEECYETEIAGWLPVSNLAQNRLATGWFDLSYLRARALHDQGGPAGFWYFLSSTWHWAEQSHGAWWHWSHGRGQLRVVALTDGPATLSGEIASAGQPDRVDVIVNGDTHSSLEITRPGFQSLTIADLPLRKGENTIEFASHNRPTQLPSDTRLLTLGLKDVSLVSDDGKLPFEFRP